MAHISSHLARDMTIPPEIRKCVVFVGVRKTDDSFQPVGSAFFLGRASSKEQPCGIVHLVTARHVIDNIRNKLLLDEVWIRVDNREGPAEWLKSYVDDWFFHPTDKSIDVAMLPTSVPDPLDHRIIGTSMCATDAKIREIGVGPGDEVLIAGLFTHHHGTYRNIPIVRVGNIACMQEEKVQTKAFGAIDAYLVEARSIGGLSGSPVFVHPGLVRLIDGALKYADKQIVLLLGLIHGHYDAILNPPSGEPEATEILTPEKINMGIAIVVPFQRIDEVLALSEARLGADLSSPQSSANEASEL